MAQAIFESWKMQQEHKPVKFLLRFMEKETYEYERRMKEAFKVWRLQAHIATLEERLYHANQSNNRDIQRSMNQEEDSPDVEWLTPMHSGGEQSAAMRHPNEIHSQQYNMKTTPSKHPKPPTQQNFNISDTRGVNININQFNNMGGEPHTSSKKHKIQSKTPNTISHKVLKKYPRQLTSAKKKRRFSKAAKEQELMIENLQTHYKKQKTMEIAAEKAIELEKAQCTFSPTVNQSGRRFQSTQQLFESLHQLARSKQQYEEDQKYYRATYKLQQEAYLASTKLQEPQSDSIHARLFKT